MIIDVLIIIHVVMISNQNFISIFPKMFYYSSNDDYMILLTEVLLDLDKEYLLEIPRKF